MEDAAVDGPLSLDGWIHPAVVVGLERGNSVDFTHVGSPMACEEVTRATTPEDVGEGEEAPSGWGALLTIPCSAAIPALPGAVGLGRPPALSPVVGRP